MSDTSLMTEDDSDGNTVDDATVVEIGTKQLILRLIQDWVLPRPLVLMTLTQMVTI